MIPKIIHYIWFGSNPFPNKIKKCIDSWRRYLPDYIFMLWNEESYDINKSCMFVREAYKLKKYAFVSDYVRLWALYKYGGLYLDTDIEILKPLESNFLRKKIVLGTDEGGFLTALMLSEPRQPFIKECMEQYHQRTFIIKNGKLDMEVNNTSMQEVLKNYGYVISNQRQTLNEGIDIYPDDYFHCRSLTSGKLHITKNSFAIHWHTITWVSKKTRIINFIRIRLIVPILGAKIYNCFTKKIKNGKTSI